MSRYSPPLPFNPHYDFHVIRTLTLSGQTLTPGMPFPKDAVPTRRLRQLYEARLISPIPPEVLPITEAGNGHRNGAESGSGSGGSNPPGGRAKPTSGALRAQHRGFGKWFMIDSAGEEVSGPHSREEAEELAAA